MIGDALLLVAFVAAALTLATVLGSLVHRPAGTEVFVDPNGPGDRCAHTVCACGAFRDTDHGRWSQLLCRR